MSELVSKLVLFQVYYPALAGLLFLALKSAGIVALGGLAVIALRRRSAAARCWVWRAVLAGCLLLPVFDHGPALIKRLRPAWTRPTIEPRVNQDFIRQARALHLMEDPEALQAP